MTHKVYSATKIVYRLVKQALEIINVFADGDEPTAAQYQRGIDAFNDIVSDLENRSPIFRKEWRTRAFQPSTIVSHNGKKYKCLKSYSSQNKNTRTNLTAYTEGALVLPSTEGGYTYIALNDGTSGSQEPSFPEYQDQTVMDGTVEWKAILSDTPGLGLDWTTYWEEYSGSSPAVPYVKNAIYVHAGDFELQDDERGIDKCYIRYKDISYEPLDLLNSSDWASLSGRPTQEGVPDSLYIFYDGINTAMAHLNPAPIETGADGYVLHYLATLRSYDYDQSVNIDFPDRWNRALKWALAAELGYEFGVSETILNRIEKKANEYIGLALGKTETNFLRIKSGW
jgi:hypothetical protein